MDVNSWVAMPFGGSRLQRKDEIGQSEISKLSSYKPYVHYYSSFLVANFTIVFKENLGDITTSFTWQMDSTRYSGKAVTITVFIDLAVACSY
jgi:hypothetical protein